MRREITMTQAHRSWNRLIDEVVTTGSPVTLTRYGKPVAALVPYGWHPSHHESPNEPGDFDGDGPHLLPSARLTPKVVARAVEVFRRHSTTNVRMVGSVARGTDHAGSDIDFLARFPESIRLFGLAELEGDLRAVIGCRVQVIFDDPRGGVVLERLRADAKPFEAAAEIAYRLSQRRGTELLETSGLPADSLAPVHPGEILQGEFLSSFGISWQALSACSGIPIQDILDIVGGRQAVTADLAAALSRGLGTTAEFWVNLQRDYDHRIGESPSSNHQ